MDNAPKRVIEIDPDDAPEFAELVKEYLRAEQEASDANDLLDEKARALAEFFPAHKEADFDAAMVATVEVGGTHYTVEAKRPLTTEWDQDALAKVIAEIGNTSDVREVVGVEYRVNKRRLASLDPAVQDRIVACSTKSPHTKSGELRKPLLKVGIVY